MGAIAYDTAPWPSPALVAVTVTVPAVKRDLTATLHMPPSALSSGSVGEWNVSGLPMVTY
jgi:hypothetical protein